MDPLADPKWMLLSYGKHVNVSSHKEGNEGMFAVDEHVKTCWTPQSANLDEWLDVDLPTKIETFHVEKEALLDIIVSFEKDEKALGYNVNFGYNEDKLYHAYMVFHDTEVPIRALNKGQDLYVRIDSFNEKGITKGKTIRVI